MSEDNSHANSRPQSIPKWFSAICWIALIWNLLGLVAFVSQMMMTSEAMSQLPQVEQDMYAATPVWVNIAFGCAVIGGALGCLALLLRKAFALYVLAISLLGVIVQMIYVILISKAIEVYGPESAIMPSIVMAIAIALVWFANRCKSKGWIL